MNTTNATDQPTTLDQYRPRAEQRVDNSLHLNRESSSVWAWVGLALVVVVFLIFRKPEPTLPPVVGSAQGGTVQVEPLGIVRRVQYIGGLHVHTQVDTTTQTFLLPGVVRVILDSPVELRKRGTERGWVCVVGTQLCSQAIQ